MSKQVPDFWVPVELDSESFLNRYVDNSPRAVKIASLRKQRENADKLRARMKARDTRFDIKKP